MCVCVCVCKDAILAQFYKLSSCTAVALRSKRPVIDRFKYAFYFHPCSGPLVLAKEHYTDSQALLR